jgi:hypothetical protein
MAGENKKKIPSCEIAKITAFPAPSANQSRTPIQ